MQERRVRLAVRQEDRDAPAVRGECDSAQLSFSAFGRRDAQHGGVPRRPLRHSATPGASMPAYAATTPYPSYSSSAHDGLDRHERVGSVGRDCCCKRLDNAAVGLLSNDVSWQRRARSTGYGQTAGSYPISFDFNHCAVWCQQFDAAEPRGPVVCFGIAADAVRRHGGRRAGYGSARPAVLRRPTRLKPRVTAPGRGMTAARLQQPRAGRHASQWLGPVVALSVSNHSVQLSEFRLAEHEFRSSYPSSVPGAASPASYTPGATNYTPGATGYNPPGVPAYQSPAAPYNASPYSTTPGSVPSSSSSSGGGYRPGGTKDYVPSSGTSGLSSPTGMVQAASYTTPTATTSNTATQASAMEPLTMTMPATPPSSMTGSATPSAPATPATTSPILWATRMPSRRPTELADNLSRGYSPGHTLDLSHRTEWNQTARFIRFQAPRLAHPDGPRSTGPRRTSARAASDFAPQRPRFPELPFPAPANLKCRPQRPACYLLPAAARHRNRAR